MNLATQAQYLLATVSLELSRDVKRKIKAETSKKSQVIADLVVTSRIESRGPTSTGDVGDDGD